MKFLTKNSILTNIFTSFSPQIFPTIFLVKSKLSTAKKSKTTTFSRVFLPKKKSTIFLGNQSWIFGQKMKISNSVLKHYFKTKVSKITLLIVSIMGPIVKGLQQLSPMACQSTTGVFSALQMVTKIRRIRSPVLILNEIDREGKLLLY